MEGQTEIEILARMLGPALDAQKARQYGVTAGYGEKHDVALPPMATGYMHGPGGLLTFPGVDPVIFSTALGTRSILNQLPTRPATNTNPTYSTITGVHDVSGSEPDAVCDPAPVAGLMKACTTWSPFGRYSRQTQVLDVTRLGKTTDRSDPMDLRLVNTPLASTPLFNVNPRGPSDVLTNEIANKFWQLDIALSRLLTRQLWQGLPSNNTGAGGYKEVTGLDLLIRTGYVDAETNAACPAVDSYVRNMSNLRVDIEATRLIAEITNMAWHLRDRADRLELAPVRWVIAMRSQLFYELTRVWPCNYLSYRCTPSTGSTNMIDAGDMVRMRDEMLAGKYLLIDGERWEVVIDDGIDEDNGNDGGGAFPRGCFRSHIYFIPMSVVGGRAVTYLEFMEYDNAAIREIIGNMGLYRVQGPWLIWPRQTNGCIVWQTVIEPRLVLRTPFLAGKLQNVVYCPIEHERSPFPNDPYFVDGGKTSRPGPSLFAHWQT